MQTRTQSLFESIINVLVGFIVAILSQQVIFPLLNYHVTLSDNIIIGLFMTGISIARSYILRRIFNKKHSKQEQKNA